MKKLYLVLIVLLFCAAANAEQTATLVHNGVSKVFYGERAFQTACDSAVSGDVINLSSGTFKTGCYYNLRKAITVRGCGWKGNQKTIIQDNCSNIVVNIESSDSVNRLCFEGIKFNVCIEISSVLHNPLFTKCWFSEIKLKNIFNGVISNCFVNRVFKENEDKRYQMTFVNSIVNTDVVMNLSFVNCIVGESFNNYGNVYINCIMTCQSTDRNLNNQSTAINCVYCGTNNNFFSECFGSNNSIVTSVDILFQNTFPMDGSWFRLYDDTPDNAHELRPEIQTQYLGNDSTQVGIYGGFRPFTRELSYPIINNLQVAPASSADGKLDVEIEVTSAE